MTYTPEKLAELKAVAEAAGDQGWYVLDTPWVGYTDTFSILQGSPDPHAGDCILETVTIEEADEDEDHARQELLAGFLEVFDPPQVLALIEEIERLRDAMPRLVDALRCFLEDQRFHVVVGGNPIAVEKMIEEARAAVEAGEELGGQKDG